MDFPPAILSFSREPRFLWNLGKRILKSFLSRGKSLLCRGAKTSRRARENLANSPNSLPSRFITTSTNHYILLFVSMKLHSADFNKNQPVPCTNHYI